MHHLIDSDLARSPKG